MRPAMVPGGERAARIAWTRLVEPEDPTVSELVARVGAEHALHSIDPGSDLGRRVAGRLEQLDVERDVAIADRLGARVVVPGDPEWPTGLDALRFPPLCLWVKGPLDLADASARSASVVGARAATGYGVMQAKEIAGGLAERGFTVVSGAAYGIDGAAHQGALAMDGGTVAVVAGGLERAYPQGHRALLEEIARAGLVVSEVPPGSAPTRWRFLSRNRMIATLTQGTVVIEAGLRSGSRSTARLAEQHHRVVCAVPGPVTSAASAGCHELIRGGAILVTDAAEVAEALGPMGELAPAKRGPSGPEDELEPGEQKVYAVLPVRGAARADDIARRCGLAVEEVVGALGLLQLAGLARRQDDGWRKSRPGR